LPLAGAGVLYHTRVGGLARGRTPVPRWRRIAFYSGLALILIALGPPLDTLDDQLLMAHMLQHVLLGDVASLLLVLGVTAPLLQPVLRWRAGRWVRGLGHPVVALPVWAVNLYVWHLPALYELALRSDAVHAVEHLAFVSFGILVWLPLVGPLPTPTWFGNVARLGYVAAVRLSGALLANVFIWSGTVFYASYAAGEHRWSIRPLADQNLAGAGLMIEESLLTLALFAWLFFKAAREGEQEQDLLDYAASRGFNLTRARAARAASAGRAAELRARIAAHGAEPIAPPAPHSARTRSPHGSRRGGSS
jgi:cytochrome c oxidase assembly factor CtaG